MIWKGESRRKHIFRIAISPNISGPCQAAAKAGTKRPVASAGNAAKRAKKYLGFASSIQSLLCKTIW